MDAERKRDVSVRDIMAADVVSVRPDTPLADAAKILAEHSFDGVPVTDTDGRLVGILTEYDLISKGSAIHLPTFQLIMENLPVLKKDHSQFQKEIQAVTALVVRDVMNSDPLTLPEDATFEQTVQTFRDHHRVNPIPIISAERKVIGVVSRFDILKPLRDLSPS